MFMRKNVILINLALSVLIFLVEGCIKTSITRNPSDTHMVALLNGDTLKTPVSTGFLSENSVTIYGGNYNNFVPNNVYPLVYAYVSKYSNTDNSYEIKPGSGNVIEIIFSNSNYVFADSGVIHLSSTTAKSAYITGSFYGKIGDSTIYCPSFTTQTF